MSTSEEQSGREHPSTTDDRRLTITVSGCSEELPAELRRVARRTLRAAGFGCGRLDIAVVGEAEMRRQHERWTGETAATDVLSFDLRDKPETGRVDGQLVACKSVARRRARSRGTDWRGELLLYVVHGCLHLCGYDDDDVEAAALMHRREDEILTLLGWGPVFSRGPSRRADGGRARRGGRT